MASDARKARLAVLRSLNWPENYDELTEAEQDAERARADAEAWAYVEANTGWMPIAIQPNLASPLTGGALSETPLKKEVIDLNTPQGTPRGLFFED